MKIDDYYRNVARISLNGSIAALIPAIVIIGGNLVLIQNKQIMLLAIPFLLYSIINFQIYLRRVRQALQTRKNVQELCFPHQSLFMSEHLVVLFYNTLSPRLTIFLPNGFLAGTVKNIRKNGRSLEGAAKTLALYDRDEKLIGFYTVRKKNRLKIEVFDKDKEYIGCLERTKITPMQKGRSELLNAAGRFVAAVDGSPFFMDEQAADSHNRLLARLRRGWMPLEWSSRFPEPNTPVFTLSGNLSENDKLLHLAVLIHEFFIER